MERKSEPPSKRPPLPIVWGDFIAVTADGINMVDNQESDDALDGCD